MRQRDSIAIVAFELKNGSFCSEDAKTSLKLTELVFKHVNFVVSLTFTHSVHVLSWLLLELLSD